MRQNWHKVLHKITEYAKKRISDRITRFTK